MSSGYMRDNWRQVVHTKDGLWCLAEDDTLNLISHFWKTCVDCESNGVQHSNELRDGKLGSAGRGSYVWGWGWPSCFWGQSPREHLILSSAVESVSYFDFHLIQSPVSAPDVHSEKQSPGKSSALLYRPLSGAWIRGNAVFTKEVVQNYWLLSLAS